MQQTLPLRDRLDINPDSPPYRRGFIAGFSAQRIASPPTSLTPAERAGWVDGHAGSQVPEWRLR